MIINKIKALFTIAALLVLTGAFSNSYAQVVYKKSGYTLTINNQSEDLDGDVLNNLIETFFTVYPVLARSYNENAVKDVEFFIDPEYKGVAEAGGGRVRISSNWLKQKPDDFDLVTHEVMHLVQAYPNEAGPWWVTEGIADYARYVYGVDNLKGGWAMPEYNSEQNYDNSYRITARFFLWIDRKVKPGFIKNLDNAMRTKTYTDKIWKNETGKNIDDLWKAYTANPVI